MFKRFLILLSALLILSCSTMPAFATTATTYFNYGQNSVVTADNLNGNLDTIRNVINGRLDNTNADTTRGFRFFEVLSALPLPGTPGRIVFLTTNNLLYFDSGTQFIPFLNVTTTPVQGDTIYYNGSAWVILNAGTKGQFFETSGPNANPLWAPVNLASSVSITGVLPIANMSHLNQLFTSSGTFTAPTGITTVYLTMCGGGGGGGGGTNAGNGGGGGGGGACGIGVPYSVTPGNNYTVTIGPGGAAGNGTGTDGVAGGNTTFDTLTFLGGSLGQGQNTGGAGGTGGVNSLNASGTTAGKKGFSGGSGANQAAGAGGAGGGTVVGGNGGAGGASGVAGGSPTDYGGGGGGAGNGGGGKSGAAGANGFVLVQY